MEGRRLLAGECGHAAPEVLGAAARRDRLGLELHLGLEALPRGLVEESLRPAERLRRPLRELARERVHGAPELAVGHDARHESPLERLTGREHAVGEVELHRWRSPTSRGRKYEDDPSGVAAIFEYAIVKRADSAAITRSPESANESPPPAATPLTAMITGLSLRARRDTVPCR